MKLNRRGFIAASAATAMTAVAPRVALAASRPQRLAATTRTLDIGGRAATVMGLVNGHGASGLVLNAGERFAVTLENRLAEPTLIHWHGQIPPNLQDGVPDMPAPLLQPGESRDYDYDPQGGTHWMHAHIPEHEMQLLAAPLIVRRPDEVAEDRQEVVMFLHDFAFAPPAEILQGLGIAPMDHATSSLTSGGMMGNAGHGMSGMAHGMGGMDLNDIDFDAYLANDRTLDDPEVVTVDKGGRIRLRIVNAAAATVFWIDTGGLEATVAAVDGQPVRPVTGRRFGLAMAQRIDLLLDLPAGGGAWPILALREGATERTGIMLATAGAEVLRLSTTGDMAAPAFDLDLAQEARFEAAAPLGGRPTDRAHMIMLGGSMEPYQWTIDGRVWPDYQPLDCRRGERVELMFHNMSMMGHPMHLHGHHFQVVGLNGRRVNGALRDTVYVPPMSSVTVALDAGEAALWMLHCHHMAHLASGMMTVLRVG